MGKHHDDMSSTSYGVPCTRWVMPVAIGLTGLAITVITAICAELPSVSPSVSGGLLSHEIFSPVSPDGESSGEETQVPKDNEVEPMTTEAPDGEAIPTGQVGGQSTHEGVFHLSSVRAINDYRAHDGGAMAEWQPGYYVAHDWSSAGQAILAMRPGDVVYVDGRRLIVAGVTQFREDEYVENIRGVLGYDCVIFQTCYPGIYNRVVYGYGESFGGFSIV